MPTPPEPSALICRIAVPDEAIDTNGHVNNVVYVQWMQDVAVRHSNESGGTQAMREAGATWVARSHHVEYLRPAFAGEIIEVSTWVANARRVSSLRRYRFTRVSDQTLLARGETEWVFISATTGRPCSIPESVRKCFPIVDSE